MNAHTILLTGDYWHHDFQAIVAGFTDPVTLIRMNKLDSIRDSNFDLIILAQSSRDQISVADVERIQAMFPVTPIVGLLGSWCEGEMRSGTAWPGVIRVYWHQWAGRYDRFANQLATAGITDWHAARTSSVGDQIAATLNPSNPNALADGKSIDFVAISAWTQSQFEMVDDAIESMGWKGRWFERVVWDGEAVRLVSVICVVADSWSAAVHQRINWIRSEIPHPPLVLLLNYPRQDQVDEIRKAGISELVSKPFELTDLRAAILRAIDESTAITGAGGASAEHPSMGEGSVSTNTSMENK